MTDDTNGNSSTPSTVDAVLLIGRIAWLLLGKRGTTLKQSLHPPATTTTTGGTQGCVGMDQLEAAFEIADTDGDGVLDTSEIQEALQAVIFGSESQARYEGHTSLTFDEFTLLATPLLEQQLQPQWHTASTEPIPYAFANALLTRLMYTIAQYKSSRSAILLLDPQKHLISGLQSVMASSTSLWAQYAAAKPTHTLTQAAAALSRDCSAVARTDAEYWRVTHGMWCNHALTLDATDDYTTTTDTTADTAANGSSSVISETITLPAAPWPPLQRYLLQLALQVAAVTCSADFATHAQLSATSLHKPLSRHGSSQLTHTSSFTTTAAAGVSDSSSATVNSADGPPDFYTAAGDALCALAASHIAAVYRGLAEGNGAPLQRSPEPARLQALLDVMLLQQLPGLRFASGGSSGSSSGLLSFGSSASSNRSSFQGVADVIGELIDPIDLQTYTPFLEATAKASAEIRCCSPSTPCSRGTISICGAGSSSSSIDGCSVLLAGAFRGKTGFALPRRGSNVSAAASSLSTPSTAELLQSVAEGPNLLALAPRTQRFDLLPLPTLGPLAAAAVHSSSNPLDMLQQQQKPDSAGGPISDGAPGSEGGLQAAGRQALAVCESALVLCITTVSYAELCQERFADALQRWYGRRCSLMATVH
eukprot:7019-Heterococcus_DN1.PRE.3